LANCAKSPRWPPSFITLEFAPAFKAPKLTFVKASETSVWKQVGWKLVRHAGGSYYLRAKAGGKVIRVELEGADLHIAKPQRDDKPAALRGCRRNDHLQRILSNPPPTIARLLSRSSEPHCLAGPRQKLDRGALGAEEGDRYKIRGELHE